MSTRRVLDNNPLKDLKKILINSAQVETKNTFILDLTGTGAAVIGLSSLIAYQVTGIKSLDGLGGMLMGVVIAISSLVLMWGVKNYLAGKSASAEMQNQIREAALDAKEVKNVLELKTMYTGSKKLLLHLDIEVNKSATAKELGEIVEALKRRIVKEVPVVSTIQVEVVPSQ